MNKIIIHGLYERPIIKSRLHPTMYYQWWWNDEKKMEIKFHLNETIEWHYMQLEFNFDLFYFNPNLIQFEFNWIQIPWELNSNSIEFWFH
jgi:ABC-type transport system substrate-binding protein